MTFSDAALGFMKGKYLQNGEDGDGMVDRVCKSIGRSDPARAVEWSNDIKAGLWIPSSPFLLNAGTSREMLSSCFVVDVPDDMEGIFDSVKEMALIQKYGGGTGMNFSKLREEGASVRSTAGVASGPVSFMQVFNSATGVIKQGGRRRGANIAVLAIDHPDIVKFIQLKRDLSQMQNFNISVLVPDEFMRRLKDGGVWTLKSRGDEPDRTISARALWDEITYSAWKTGDPGLLFTDRIEEANPTPHLGKLDGVNPCLTGDTIMIDGNRLLPIGYEDDEATTFDKWSTGVKRIIRLSLSDGRFITLTPDHKIKTMHGWVPAGKCLGEKIIENNRDYQGGELVRKPAAELQGFLAGDGFLSAGGMGVSVKLDSEKESEVAQILLNGGFKHEKSGSYYKQLRELPSYNPVGAFAKRIPGHILFGDASTLASYLRGLFEANGCVVGTARVAFKTVSRGLCTDIQNALSLFGIRSYVTTNITHRVRFKNGSYVCAESYDLNIASMDGIIRYRTYIGFISESKISKLSAINRAPGTIRWPTVVAIEDAGIQKVYDFRMKAGDHENSANGIIVHNCGEISLYAGEACNLASINLTKFVKGETINYLELRRVAASMTRFLDTAIDINEFPMEKIRERVQLTRKIGIGITGLHEALIMMGVPYASGAGRTLASSIMYAITDASHVESRRLGSEIGVFPGWRYSSICPMPRRNATCTAIAPTGTISMIMGVTSSGCEPLFSLGYSRRINGQDFKFDVPTCVRQVLSQVEEAYGVPLEDMLKEIADNDGSAQGIAMIPNDVQELLRTAQEMSADDHLLMQAALQIHTDNNISKTVNLSSGATERDVDYAYRMAWELQLRGITVYRDGSRSGQVLKHKEEKEEKPLDKCPVCGEAIVYEEGCAHCPSCGWSVCSTS